MNLSRVIVSVVVLLTVSACASLHSSQNDGKYNLGDQLEMVDGISRYTLNGWETVDNRSFVLQTGPGRYFLIVLFHPSTELMFSERIKISSTGSFVRAGFDKVTIYQSGRGYDYAIDKIYKFKDYEQVKEIRAQLTGGK